VSRERLINAALRAYPRSVRDHHGSEMLSTVLDSTADAPRRLPREILDLVRVGLRSRATETAQPGVRRVIADGLCRGATWVMTLDLSTLLAQRMRGMHDPLLSPVSIAGLAAVLAVALIGYDRLAGVGGLVWTVSRTPEVFHHHPSVDGLLPTVVPVICFAVLLLAPRRRAPMPHRLGWLAVPAVLVAAFGPAPLDGPLIAVAMLVVALTGLCAIALLPTDPRLAIAAAVPAAYLGLQIVMKPDAPIVLKTLLLAPVPIVLAITIARSRQLQQPTG